MNTTNDLRTALAGDDGTLPERWNPDDEPGTTLIGTFQGIEIIATSLGEAQIAVIEDEDDGTMWGVMLGRTVLKKRWEALAPRPGDTVGIKYVGFVEPRNKDARGYHNYVVRVIRGGEPATEPQTVVTAASASKSVNAPDTGADDDIPF